MGTYVKICMLTQSCLVAPQCILALLTECKKKSLPLLLLPSKLRSLLLLRGNTLSGSVAPSWHHCQLSNKCGFPSKNMTNVVHQLFTENVSNDMCVQHETHSKIV